jgi:hypothetical protein
VALALWGAFQVMELTFQYAFEAVHRDLFTGTLATLLVIAGAGALAVQSNVSGFDYVLFWFCAR